VDIPAHFDEFTIALSPVLFGSGIRLFEGVDASHVALEQVRAQPTRRVTHLTYAVRERQQLFGLRDRLNCRGTW
jgi:dihydrofolate reductase